MSRVFAATEKALGREVVIKVLAPELAAVNFPAQQLPVFRNRPRHFRRRFVQKFHAEIPHAQRQQPRHIFRAGLRLGIEHGVAAAGIGLQRMFRAHAVAQLHIVRVARAAAVAIILAAGKKRAEHAMLHVKHWHVLVDRHLKPVRRRARQQRFELRHIQIVAGRHALEAELVLEIIRREVVRHVERIIPDAPRVRKKFQVVVVAHEVTIGMARAHEVQNPFLAGFENTRRGDEDARSEFRLQPVRTA